jgi:hypothetical protein
MDVLVHGIDIRFHPLTKLPLEDGSRALPDDEQALQIHIPHILKTQGIAAARAMCARLTGAKPQLVENDQ